MNHYAGVQTFGDLLFRHRVSGCFGLRQKWYANNVHVDTCARASTGMRQAQMPTIESRSMNGRGQAEEQVLWWWQIWLLSTSAFLNTRSYLASPLEERSLLFSILLLPPLHPSLPLISAQPSLLTHLSSSHLSLYTSLAHFPFFFPGVSGVLFSLSLHSSPHYPLLPLLLNGTAHSATKQSCRERHTLANQAGSELGSLRTHSATSGYGGVLGWRGGGASPEKKPEKDKYSKSNDAY